MKCFSATRLGLPSALGGSAGRILIAMLLSVYVVAVAEADSVPYFAEGSWDLVNPDGQFPLTVKVPGQYSWPLDMSLSTRDAVGFVKAEQSPDPFLSASALAKTPGSTIRFEGRMVWGLFASPLHLLNISVSGVPILYSGSYEVTNAIAGVKICSSSSGGGCPDGQLVQEFYSGLGETEAGNYSGRFNAVPLSVYDLEIWVRTFSLGDLSTAFIDPIFTIDPDWEFANDFQLVFSPGVSNGPTTPIPAALPLFVTGLGVMGLLGWRRKRKHAA